MEKCEMCKILGEALKMCMHHKAFGTTFDFEMCQHALEIYQFGKILSPNQLPENSGDSQ